MADCTRDFPCDGGSCCDWGVCRPLQGLTEAGGYDCQIERVRAPSAPASRSSFHSRSEPRRSARLLACSGDDAHTGAGQLRGAAGDRVRQPRRAGHRELAGLPLLPAGAQAGQARGHRQAQVEPRRFQGPDRRPRPGWPPSLPCAPHHVQLTAFCHAQTFARSMSRDHVGGISPL